MSPTSPVGGRDDDVGKFNLNSASSDCNCASLPL